MLCDCLHTKEQHHNDEGQCSQCACTWYHPGITAHICKIFNDAFGEPFLESGFVFANDVSDIYGQPAINLRIGSRDVSFGLCGEFLGSGTHFPSKWFEGTIPKEADND